LKNREIEKKTRKENCLLMDDNERLKNMVDMMHKSIITQNNSKFLCSSEENSSFSSQTSLSDAKGSHSNRSHPNAKTCKKSLNISTVCTNGMILKKPRTKAPLQIDHSKRKSSSQDDNKSFHLRLLSGKKKSYSMIAPVRSKRKIDKFKEADTAILSNKFVRTMKPGNLNYSASVGYIPSATIAVASRSKKIPSTESRQMGKQKSDIRNFWT